jgi:opacity protein-like surface antigen
MSPLRTLVLASFSIAVCRAALAAEAGPPPMSVHYLHYGVAVVTETVADSGDVCPSAPRSDGSAAAPCILGSGVGAAIRIGYRSREPWYFGGAYEFSRQDASNLLNLPVLQQLRAETRYYFDTGRRLTPYVTAGLGAALYGNEWLAETWGVTSFLGAGLEFQLSESLVMGPAAAYRPFLFRSWTDGAGQRRADGYLGFGLAHLIALEVVLEIRDPLSRW